MLISIYHLSIFHHFESFLKCIERYWFIASRAKKKIWLPKIENIILRGGFPWIFTDPKNCYRWFSMIPELGNEKLFSMGIEILGLGWIQWHVYYDTMISLFLFLAVCDLPGTVTKVSIPFKKVNFSMWRMGECGKKLLLFVCTVITTQSQVLKYVII